MGLDMYIFRCNRTQHSLEELKEIDNRVINGEMNPDKDESSLFLPFYESSSLNNFRSIFHMDSYWRKAWPIHEWFVQHVQNGSDDCQLHELTRENLEKLKKFARNHINNDFPDESEREDSEKTIKAVDQILAMDWSKYRFFYQSSW